MSQKEERKQMEARNNQSVIKTIFDSPIGRNVKYFVRWALIAYIIGFLGGLVGGIFALSISKVTEFRVAHPWTLFLMPLAGLLIVWCYQITGEGKNSGTNMVLASISADETITKATGPLIFISTVLTHLVGGSAGREGAALQLGGWIGSQISKISLFRLDEKEKKMTIMVGMSAVFSALFGTPVAAAFFSMEVISVGIIYYAAMLPCLLAAFLGKDVALKMGIEYDLFSLGDIPKLGIATVQPVVLLGFLVSVLGILFIIILHGFEHKSKKWIPNPYLRILACACAFIILTVILGSTMYSGSGVNLILQSMEGNVRMEAFLLKIIFTTLTIGGGFKGGEIIPTLSIGASFGATYGNLIHFEPVLMAACGMIGLFAAVTNCPIASILLGLELFHGDGISYFAAIVSITFSLSGYYSLYGTQKFIYGKLKNVYLNRLSNH